MIDPKSGQNCASIKDDGAQHLWAKTEKRDPEISNGTTTTNKLAACPNPPTTIIASITTLAATLARRGSDRAR